MPKFSVVLSVKNRHGHTLAHFWYLGINGSCHERQLSMMPKYNWAVFRFGRIDPNHEINIEEKAHAGNATQNIHVHPPLMQKTRIHIQPHTLYHS